MVVAAGAAVAKSPVANKGAKQRHRSKKPEVEVDVERIEICFEQNKVRDLYNVDITQFTVAFLIFLNFLSEAANAQILPADGSNGAFTFLIFEFIFNISFTIELVWNMYGSWFFQFWDSGWNWFDFIIVIISLLAMLLPGLPGISVLRLFRAFRVFRLFKRIKSLKKIIEGVLGALPGVSQAFLVLGILMGIWSVIGVEFFKDHQPEFFGNFMKGMLTLFQIMTMDSWSSGIARELIFSFSMPLASVFFISYIFIAGIVMTNVVVAILLDKYLEAIDKDKQEEQKEKDAQDKLEADARDEDPAKPELTLWALVDGQMKPLRGLTWHRYDELEEWFELIDEEDEELENMRREANKESDSDSEDESDISAEEHGGPFKDHELHHRGEKNGFKSAEIEMAKISELFYSEDDGDVRSNNVEIDKNPSQILQSNQTPQLVAPGRRQESTDVKEEDSDEEIKSKKKKKKNRIRKEDLPEPDAYESGEMFYRDHKISRVLHEWSVPIVLKWLDHIKFDDFRDKFDEENVDGAILTQLSDCDLRAMGMTLARRKSFMNKLYELELNSKWIEKGDDNYDAVYKQSESGVYEPKRDIKPRNSIVRYPTSPRGSPKPASREVDNVEYMHFNENNSRMPMGHSPRGSDHDSNTMAGILADDPPGYSDDSDTRRQPYSQRDWRDLGGDAYRE